MRGMQLVGAMLATLAILGTGLALAQAEPEGDSSRSAALSAPPQASPGAELKSERTATSETFALPNGSWETRIYESPIHYRDSKGEWKPIGDRFEEVDGGKLTNGPNGFDVSLPSRLGSEPVRLRLGDGEWVAYELAGSSSKPVVLEGETAVYEATDPGTRFELTSLPNGIKEDIVIADASQPSTFAFELSASAGLESTLTEDGAIEFRDARGELAASMPAPVVSDSSLVPQASNAARYGLEPQGEDRWRLIVEADREWLERPERVWPAIIDPTLTIPTPSLDCEYGAWLGTTGSGECGFEGDEHLYTRGFYNLIQPPYVVRTALKFDLSEIPAASYIESATVGLYSPWKPRNTVGVELRRATKPWTSGVNWKKYDGTNTWTNEGGDSESIGAQITTSAHGNESGWWNFSSLGLTETVQGWISSTLPNQGLIVRLSDDAVKDCTETECNERFIPWESSIAEDPNKRPYLSVVYDANPVVVETGAATEVTSKKAKLSASVNPNGLAATYQLEYGTTTSYGAKVPLEAKSIGAGTSPVAANETISGLQEGTTYHYRAVATNAAGTVFGQDKTLTTVDAPQTMIVSPTPTYTARDEPPIEFESNQSGSTFKCALDEGEEPTKACTSPYMLPEHLDEGWHTFVVAATDEEGSKDPTPAKWTFNPAIYPDAPSTAKVTSPEEGHVSAGRKFTSNEFPAGSSGYFTLKAAWGGAPEGGGVTGVTFQAKLKNWNEFRTIPVEDVIDANGDPVSWPLPVSQNPGETSPVFFNMDHYEYKYAVQLEYGIKFRAVFDGGVKAAGASEPISVSYSRWEAPTDAREELGPVSLDLVTGKYTMSRTDVSIPVPGTDSNLEFTRVYNSAKTWEGPGVLGKGWEPSAPVEQEYEEEAWQKIVVQHQPAIPPYYERECWNEEGETVACGAGCPPESCEEWLAEEEVPEANWVEVLTNNGTGLSFDKVGESTYVPPAEAQEYKLTKSGSSFVLADPNGTRTVFTQAGANSEYRVSTVSFQASPTDARMVYEGTGSNLRLKMIIAPSLAGITCTDAPEDPNYAPKKAGCRSLDFNYLPLSTWTGTSSGIGTQKRLASITYYDSSGSGTGQVVAEYAYSPNTFAYGELIAEWDPRISPNLKETYTYDRESGSKYQDGGLLTQLTPPGEEPWEFDYYAYSIWTKLRSVSRASLLESPPEATTTVVYGVPLSGSEAPYDMSPNAVAKWGQSDFPVNATAIFPPTAVPSGPPSDYSKATITYMDPDGYAVNTASPKFPGAGGPSITTSETDQRGNVTRSLTARNRLLALAEGSKSVTRAHELESRFWYSSDGTEMLESWGPRHKVRLNDGKIVEANTRKWVQYDQGFEPKKGETAPRLPTKEVVDAYVPALGKGLEARVTETKYDWELRKPIEEIVDPEGLNLVSKTLYNSAGQVKEERQPADPEGKTAGTTRTVYWTAGANSENASCGSKAAWAGLPCVTHPVAEPSPAGGSPKLPWSWFTDYSALDAPTETQEKTDGKLRRTTAISYDAAGRPLMTHVTGEGTAIPTIETAYDEETGAPLAQRFVCESVCEASASYASSFGSSGSANGQFNRPAGSAFDAQGNLWVVDSDNNRVQKLDLEGNYLFEFGSFGSANGQLNDPMDVAIDANGDLWVADRGNSRVQKFNAKGEYLTKFGSNGSGSGQFSGYGPRSIAIDAQGELWVSDYSGRVQEFDAEGEFVKAAGQFGESAGIDVAEGKVWVGDWTQHRVSVFSDAGKFLFQFGSSGTGKGQFSHPDSIEVDAKGNVWVLDQGNSRVQQFDQEGKYVNQFGAKGSGQGQFSFAWPTGMTSDANGDLWVSDVNNHRVQKWTVSASFDDPRETRTEYDALGRPIEYEDADGNVSGLAYDLLGRPTIVSDGKGYQTISYDESSGVATEMTDSAAGAFKATYDADGQMTEQLLPNGLAQKVEYDPAGAPVGLGYVKVTGCEVACTWLDFSREYSAAGQVLRQESTLSSQDYSYDKAGRLTLVKDTEAGQCTTRAYAFDKNTNRTSLTTREPKEGGGCDTESKGESQGYEYDSADRLIGEGVEYDNLGRTTSLPGKYAGGGELATGYYVNDLTRSQSQGGITNTYELDASLRQRVRTQTKGEELSTEIYHYAGGSDSPAWIEEIGAGEPTWTRSIAALGGSLGALQKSSGEITLQLADMHGDIVATADIDPEAKELLSTQAFDEYGNPKAESTPKLGWLGSKARRTELPSGVIQMGVRSYIPAIGRFLSPDPIRGGSANAYEYAAGDPINNFDLTGEKCVGNAKWVARCKKKKDRAAARRANKQRMIKIKFGSRRGAERFARYLQSASRFLERMQAKVGKWHAEDIREMKKRAAEAAAKERGTIDQNANACGWIGWGAGAAATGLALSPATGGASFILGVFATGTGLGSLTGAC